MLRKMLGNDKFNSKFIINRIENLNFNRVLNEIIIIGNIKYIRKLGKGKKNVHTSRHNAATSGSRQA